ncbi:hsp70 [Nucleospora cyclopteri]
MLGLISILSKVLCDTAEKQVSDVYVGIDLGTTFTCVCLFHPKSKTYEYLTFGGDMQETLPSTVYIEEEKNGSARHYIGYEAERMNQQNPSPTNYLYGFKRLMGIAYKEPIVQRFRNNVTYKLEPFSSTAKADPIVVFPVDNGKTKFTPTELSAMILGKIHRQITENYKIISTVVTTPAYFSIQQDTQTREAAKSAGFEEVAIFKEPTAACIEYAQKKLMTLNKEEKILVFDLGGGTFDISIVEVENEDDDKKVFSNITVAKYVGDNFLGGENVNSAIVHAFKKEISVQLSSIDDLRLRLFVEKMKIKACNAYKADLTAVVKEKFFFGKDQEVVFTLDKQKFDKLAAPVYDKIDELLFDRNNGLFRTGNQESLDKPVDIADIEKIVLVGGSTRIPYIKEYLIKKFKKATIFDGIDADKSVASGACIMCVNSDKNSGEQSVMLLNATTLPIGIAVHDGSFKSILMKDLVIPTESSEIFSTVEDNQTKIVLQVASGVRPMFGQNEYIGKFELELKEPKPRGVPRIQVKCSMSAEYKLTVTATDLDTNVSTSKVFSENYVGTDKKRVQEILEQAKLHEAEDNETTAKLEQLRLFDSAIELYSTSLEKAKGLNENDQIIFKTTLDTHKDWLKQNKETVKSDEIEAQLKLLNDDSKQLHDAITKAAEKAKEEQQEEKKEEKEIL